MPILLDETFSGIGKEQAKIKKGIALILAVRSGTIGF